MRKVIVSTNYDDMTNLNPELENVEGFDLFVAYTDPAGNPVKPAVCWCSANNGCFQIFNGQETDLIFIQDGVTSFNGVINQEDYFLAHDSTFKVQIGIATQFQNNHFVRGHHHPTGQGNCSYHRIVAEIMTDSRIAPNKKAEAIIERIWPHQMQLKNNGVQLLGGYLRQKPQGDCPEAFLPMIKAYEALKSDESGIPGDEAYTQAFENLSASFAKHYSK